MKLEPHLRRLAKQLKCLKTQSPLKSSVQLPQVLCVSEEVNNRGADTEAKLDISPTLATMFHRFKEEQKIAGKNHTRN